MEKMMINVLVFVALLVAVDAWRDQAIANAAPPPPSYDCFTIRPTLISCLDYCQKGSNASKPTPECCSALVKVLKENATCFCGVMQYAWKYGFNVNVTRGMMIPPLCGIPHDNLPPGARCNETSPTPSLTHPPGFESKPCCQNDNDDNHDSKESSSYARPADPLPSTAMDTSPTTDPQSEDMRRPKRPGPGSGPDPQTNSNQS